jgi:hypothetical protein
MCLISDLDSIKRNLLPGLVKSNMATLKSHLINNRVILNSFFEWR